MTITRNFKLCLNAGIGLAPYINVNQYDQGEQWVFTLYQEDGTQYTPSTGAIVGIKADHFGIINTGTVVDGKVVINETQQMTAAAGIAIFELLIDGDSHGTANFLVNVEQRPGDNADLSDSDLSLIQEAIDSAAEIEELLGGHDVPSVITPIISDWLDENITNPSSPPIDTSLTVAGAAADAKATGDEITDLNRQIGELKEVPVPIDLGTASSGTYKGEVGSTIDITGTSTNYDRFSPINVLVGQKYRLTVYQSTSSNYPHFAWATDDNGLIKGAYGIKQSTQDEYTYTFEIPSGATKLYVMTQIRDSVNHYKPTLLLLTYPDLQSQINETAEVVGELDNFFNPLTVFTNITCIGDSLTHSMVYTAENTTRQAYTTYPETLAILTGATCNAIAKSGASASEWWRLYAEQITQKTNLLTIIYLGTNDGLTDTIDTDCVGDDYTQWADTDTGCYGKIIASSLAVGSRVLLVKVYAGQTKDTTNDVIGKFATKFGVAVVDAIHLTDSKFHSYPDGTGTNTVHYNDFGYAAFADILIKRVSNLCSDSLKLLIPA